MIVYDNRPICNSRSNGDIYGYDTCYEVSTIRNVPKFIG